MSKQFQNQLYYGDNLAIMEAMADDSIDLIYLDPPFNSKRNYNIMYRTMTGQPVPEQVEAFCDSWEMDAQKEEIAANMPAILARYGIDDLFIKFWMNWIAALRSSQPSLLAYLVYMTVRLLEMRRILKPSGSIYLHCDTTASHYIKIVMDGMFGSKNFLNEIIWCYRKWTNSASYFQRNHDSIFAYAKNFKSHIFNKLFDENTPQKAKYDKGWDVNRVDGGIKQLLVYDRNKAKEKIESGNYDKIIYREDQKGSALPDWWQIPILNSQAKERLGYPTQKPIALLDRIIKASCPEDGIVFDPFCGCGTTVAAAHLNKRKWIGCDIAILSVKLIQEVLKERYNLLVDRNYRLDGIPTSIEGARVLFEKDPFQFQHWCIEKVGGFCNSKKTADRGIDGRIYFKTNQKNELAHMILSVKGGHIKPSDLRDLRGVMDREKSQMGGLIIAQTPTKSMREEAASAGFYELNGTQYQKMQIITVEDILIDKKLFDLPNKITHKAKSDQMRFYF